jgi:hypothetical protein
MESQSERRGLDPVAVHALSNHLAVVLGFIELVISETPDEDPRKADLEEIRRAAHECAQIVAQSHR